MVCSPNHAMPREENMGAFLEGFKSNFVLYVVECVCMDRNMRQCVYDLVSYLSK